MNDLLFDQELFQVFMEAEKAKEEDLLKLKTQLFDIPE